MRVLAALFFSVLVVVSPLTMAEVLAARGELLDDRRGNDRGGDELRVAVAERSPGAQSVVLEYEHVTNAFIAVIELFHA